MWAHRTRRGKKNKEEEKGSEEIVIEINHPTEGPMVYRPSSTLMPARPLGAPFEAPIIAPLVKKEIGEDGAEAESTCVSAVGAAAESMEVSQTIVPNYGVPSENAPEDVTIKTEPPDGVSDNTESMGINSHTESMGITSHTESSLVIEKNTAKLNQDSAEYQEGAEVDGEEKKPGGQTLALWDLETMFADTSSRNIDQPPADSLIPVFQPIPYLEFCFEHKEQAEECLKWVELSFPHTKKNKLFHLEDPPRKNIPPAVEDSPSVVTKPAVDWFSTEALKRILAASNVPNHPLPETKETVIKKETVSPKKKEAHTNLVDAAEGNTSTKANSVPNIPSVVHPAISKTVSDVKVTPKESDAPNHPLPKPYSSIPNDTIIKKEPVSPKKKETHTNLVDALEGNTSIKANSVPNIPSVVRPAISKTVSGVKVTPKESKAPNHPLPKPYSSIPNDTIIKKEPVSPKKKETHTNLVDALEGNTSIKANSVPNIPSVVQPAISKIVSDITHKESSKRKKPDDFELLETAVEIQKEPLLPQKVSINSGETSKKRKKSSETELNLHSKHLNKEIVPVESMRNDRSLEKINPAIFNVNVVNKSGNLDSSLSKSKTTLQDNVSSLPIAKGIPGLIHESPSNSVARIPVINRFLTSDKAQTPNYESLPQKRKMTAQEYLQRKSRTSNSNNVSKCSTAQVSLPLDQMHPVNKWAESPVRDPRLLKNVFNTPSMSSSLPLNPSMSSSLPLNPSMSSSLCIEPFETGQNVGTFSSLKNNVPISGERLPRSQELKEPPKSLPLSATRRQNDFEPRRGNNSSVMRQLREKIGRRFIAPGDVTGLILEWNVSWLEKQNQNSIVPPIFHETFRYPEVQNNYESVESYYNTYLPLHLLNIWMSMLSSWKQQEFLPDGFFEGREEKSTYVKIWCSVIFKADNTDKLPKTEDILICYVHGQSKTLFGKVVNVNLVRSYEIGTSGDVKAEMDIICAENFDVNSRRPITLQKLNNVRISLHICHSLKFINSLMRLAVLQPKDQRSQIGVIHTESFISAHHNKKNMEQIMRAIKLRNQYITLVHTQKPSDSLKAITYIVPEVVNMGGLIFLCMKEEETFFAMAGELEKYDPVLAVKEEDVPNLSKKLNLTCYTINRIKEPERFQRCQVVLTLMSAMFVGELDNRLRRESLEEDKRAICLVYEAHKFLETETSLLLEHNFKSLILLGRNSLVENIAPKLTRQSFHKSLFNRIYDSNVNQLPLHSSKFVL